jgi:protocatechuate 3,4-dioxygenase beta subunit
VRRIAACACGFAAVGAGFAACTRSGGDGDRRASTTDFASARAAHVAPRTPAARTDRARAATATHSATAAPPTTEPDADVLTLLPAGASPPSEPRPLRGRVTDGEGRPVAGVVVEFHTTWRGAEEAEFEIGPSWCGWEWTGSAARATTGRDGTFSVRGFDGAGRTLFVRDAAGRGLRWVGFDAPFDQTAEIVLPDGPGRIEGSVTAPDGSPVPGADVVLGTTTCPVPAVRDLGLHHCDPPNWFRAVVTDADGRWSCEGLPAGDVVVHATAVGFAASDRVRVRTRGAHVELRLRPGPEPR